MSTVESPLFPQALDAEEALLGCILIDPDALRVARSLRPADFYRDAHATIFATMRQLDDDGLAVDPVTLTTRLERTGQLERAGGSASVFGLVNAVPTSQNARYYASLIQQAAAGREVIQLAGDLASIGYHSSDPAKAALRAVETLAAAQTDEQALDLSPEEARERLAALAPMLYTADELMAAGFSPPQWVVPDLLAEGLTLLAAKPKLGKSWLALSLALAVAAGASALGSVPVEQGAVLYLALEDHPRRLHQRIGLLLPGQPAPHALSLGTEWPRLDQGGLGHLELWLQGHPDARLIILDTLAKIRGQARSGTLYGDDYASLEEVQKLAHAYHVAILVIHHTGKESREDPLDEVNATQGLNGVADNVLVLRRERGKPTATLIGDGRELTGIEQTLAFDLDTGGWRLTDAPVDQPKTPERAEILDLLKTSEEPMSPKQVAEALDRNVNTISNMLRRMVRDGDLRLVGYGKYTTVASVATVATSEASSFKKDEKKDIPTLFDKAKGTSSSKVATLATLATGVRENDTEAGTGELHSDDPPPEAPPAEVQRFAEMVAREMHSRVGSYAQVRKDSAWPVAGACTGVFCAGECVCGEHICDACACEAGALVDHHPWYFERLPVRRGAVCEYCYAPATVASRWKTPMCERCWLIASRGQGMDPRGYQPRPFGPIPGDEEVQAGDISAGG